MSQTFFTKAPTALNLETFIQVQTDRILDACTQCGNCVDACPMTKYTTIDASDVKSSDVVSGVLSILAKQPGTPEAIQWVRVCTNSGECVSACPANVNPLLMVRLARMVASGGTGVPVQLPMNDDLAHFPRVKAFAEMQLTPQEVKEWL